MTKVFNAIIPQIINDLDHFFDKTIIAKQLKKIKVSFKNKV